MTFPFLGDALALATLAHQGARYGTGPYVDHPVAVARILMEATGDPELAAAGLLHDTVEDTFVTLDMLRRCGFTARIVMAVDAVTRRNGELYLDFVRRAAQSEDGRRVKLADNQHNLSGLPKDDRRVPRYVRARRILINANGRVNLSGESDDPLLSWADPECKYQLRA